MCLGRSVLLACRASVDWMERMETHPDLNEMHSRLFAVVSDILAVASTDGYFVNVNPAFERILGYTFEEATRRRILDFLHPNDVAATQAELDKLADRVPTTYFVNRYQVKTGGYRWLSWKAVLSEDDHLIYAVARDITHQRETQAAVQKSQQELVDVLESIGDAFFAVDDQWRFTYLNAEAEHLLLRQRDELLGKNLWSELPEAVGSTFYKEYHRAVEDHVTVSFVEYYAPLDSWFEVRAYPSAGQLAVYFTNINERRKIEEEKAALLHEQRMAVRLKDEANALVDNMFNATPIGLALIDREIRFQRVNTALAAANGIPPEQHIGRTPEGLLPGTAGEGTADMFRRILKNGQPVQFETSSATPDTPDETKYWLTNYYPIRLYDEIIGVGVAIVDITARIRAEEERQQLLLNEQVARAEAELAVRMRDEFLSIAAHELRTPVTSLRGYAQLILRQLERQGTIEPITLQRAIVTINQQSVKLSTLIGQLLDISRIDSGRLVLERHWTDITELIDGIVSAFRRDDEQHLFTFNVPGPLEALVDAIRLEQVLVNLLSNAVKFSPEGTAIDIRAWTADDTETLHITVTDHGVGIPPERRSQLFDRFYQAHGEGFLGGMGLGLYVSRQIIDLHNGQLKAEFPDEGGTRFVIRLPLR